MMVDDFDLIRAILLPNETYSPLIVNANGPLPCANAPKLFQTVVGRLCQITHVDRCIKHSKLATRHIYKIGWETLRTSSIQEERTAPIREASDRIGRFFLVSWHDTRGP
jgi:hypothetical protein